MDKQAKQKFIHARCDENNCSENNAKRHERLFVDTNWNVHPAKGFEKWWRNHPDYQQGIDARRACNCARYMDEYMEAKSTGITDIERPNSSRAIQSVESVVQENEIYPS